MVPFFPHIFRVSVMEFAHLCPSHWLEVLIICNLSAEILMFRQDNILG
jgi:hypothetical protein